MNTMPDERVDEFVTEVQRLIDGDDIHIAEIHRYGVSGFETFVHLACGKTRARVFMVHNTNRSPAETAQQQVPDTLKFLRLREAQRLADDEALQSTVARFYVEPEPSALHWSRATLLTGEKKLHHSAIIDIA
jgi:hypothetical protein